MRYLPLLLLFLACGQPPETPVATATLGERDYELTPVAGTAAERAVARDPLGTIMEEGFVENGVKQGCWTEYNIDSKLPEKITNYLDGALNGPYIETDGHARLTKIANYRANQLHGRYAEYRSGNPVKEANYVDGQLHGVVVEYDFRTRKVKQEVHYKMGVLDGPFRYFNDEGEIMQEWTYVDGERTE